MCYVSPIALTFLYCRNNILGILGRHNKSQSIKIMVAPGKFEQQIRDFEVHFVLTQTLSLKLNVSRNLILSIFSTA